jgi:GT2 family glycosyltransferase
MDITVVIVTYNRLEMLKKAISCYERQTLMPKSIIVINNASTDGTKEFLDEWSSDTSPIANKVVIHSEVNTGGTGGFFSGINEALNQPNEWIWVSDDDAFPHMDALENLEMFYNQVEHKEDVVALCSQIINNGNCDIVHRRYIKPSKLKFMSVPVPTSMYENCNGGFPIDLFTFVGTMIRKDAVEKVGLPIKEFFIYFDDIEYSYRLRKEGKMYCVPSSIVQHDQKKQLDKSTQNWRLYYQARNRMYFMRKYYPVQAKMSFLKQCVKMILKHTVKDKIIMDAMVAGKKGDLGIDKKYHP